MDKAKTQKRKQSKKSLKSEKNLRKASKEKPSRTSKAEKKMEYIVIHVAGAVYCLSDMVIFELLRNVAGELMMRVIVQIEDVVEENHVFRWSEMPAEVLEIYNYVNSKSFFKHNILYGTHIGRKQDHQYALIKFDKHPVGENNTSPLVNSPDADPNIFKEMCMRMKHNKNIV